MKKLLYQIKYYLTRSYVLAFASTLILYYYGVLPTTDALGIFIWFGGIWFGLWAIRDTLLGFSVIPDTSEIYHGDEEGSVKETIFSN